MTRVLLLGGTTEASRLAHVLKNAGIETVFSYAGRTAAPVAQPVPTRIGGFGGVTGLVDYMTKTAITHMVDATHPFAAGMSRNAHAAAVQTRTALIRLERPAWQAQPGDDWRHFADLHGVVTGLPDIPARIFLAIGKQHVGVFAAAPQHHYLLRLVDPPADQLPLPACTVIVDRGPFSLENDLGLLEAHRVTHVVAKNAGGDAARAKIDAARRLGLPVLMVDRPALPEARLARNSDDILAFLGHDACRGV